MDLDLTAIMAALESTGPAGELIRSQQSQIMAMLTGGPSSSNTGNSCEKENVSKKEDGGISSSYIDKDSSGIKPTRLEKHLGLHAESRSYINDGKHDEAYGKLTILVKLGKKASFAPVLVNYYKALISTGRIEESGDILKELLTIFRENLKTTSKECELLADKFRHNNEQFKAILFYQLAGALFTSGVEIDDIVNCLQGCILGLKLSIAKLLKERPDLRYIVTLYIVPAMREIYNKIRTMKSSKSKVMTLIKALVLHHIETTELKADDPHLREGTLREAIALMENKFGEKAKKHHLYSAHLNNLGVTLYSMHKPREALPILHRAIEARQEAEDYDTPEEKIQDLEMTAGAISKAEEMIEYMREQTEG